jgi:hypothetical protein
MNIATHKTSTGTGTHRRTLPQNSPKDGPRFKNMVRTARSTFCRQVSAGPSSFRFLSRAGRATMNIATKTAMTATCSGQTQPIDITTPGTNVAKWTHALSAKTTGDRRSKVLAIVLQCSNLTPSRSARRTSYRCGTLERRRGRGFRGAAGSSCGRDKSVRNRNAIRFLRPLHPRSKFMRDLRSAERHFSSLLLASADALRSARFPL